MSEREGKDNNKRCALLTDSRQRVRKGKQSQGGDTRGGKCRRGGGERGRERKENWSVRGEKEGRQERRGKEITTQREGVIAEVLGERKQRDWMKMRGECEEGEM